MIGILQGSSSYGTWRIRRSNERRELKKEEERKAWEAEQERRRNDLSCWEYHIAKAQKNNRRLRDSDRVEKSTDVWPPPSPE
jgi:hypothetical protein